MISLSHRFVFVHAPKTAGNAIQEALLPYAVDRKVLRPGQDGVDRYQLVSPFGTGKHSSLAEMLAGLGPERFRGLRRLAAVCNPWDRAVSFYFSPHRGVNAWDRDAFIAAVRQLRPVSEYLRLPAGNGDPPGRPPLDAVIRFERLQDDFDGACRLLGLPPAVLPVRNRGHHGPWRDYYDQGLIDLVAERFRDDCAAFGYAWT